ncbi:hypothetical protein BBK82_38015 [Lentzea guizhouensis]|uniref:Uncharacterized protein n=1 Tax=Lentzea guizhouensis TaxID=1586287 RepID=A0A1B2HT75_9PSEU|nr:hypothetical protein [Lentzea guizhouensis]ANZ40924.1 hypothetical protein BBK82_38015 [Lentzea guizhouensis]
MIGRIYDFLAGSPCGYVWVEADAGLGKTALVAHLARERDWICHFSRYTEGRSVRAGLQNLAAQLVVRHELWKLAPGRLLPDWMCTPAGFERLLVAAADQGDKVVLLVDVADEAETEPGAQPWGLPTHLPAGVFVVGTYRTGSPPARCAAPRAVLRVSAQDEDNLHDMRAHLREHAPAGVHVEDLAARCGGVWVYLRYVLDEIRLGLRRPDDLGDLPGDLRSFYLAHLGRWREHYHWQGTVLPLVSTLAAAEEALPLDSSPACPGRTSAWWSSGASAVSDRS